MSKATAGVKSPTADPQKASRKRCSRFQASQVLLRGSQQRCWARGKHFLVESTPGRGGELLGRARGTYQCLVLGFFSFAERVEGFVQGQAAKRLRVSCCHRCQLRGSVGWGAEGGGENRFTSTELFVSPAPLVPREFLVSCASFPARNLSLSFVSCISKGFGSTTTTLRLSQLRKHQNLWAKGRASPVRSQLLWAKQRRNC